MHIKSIHYIVTKTKNMVEVNEVQVISSLPLQPPSSNIVQNMELIIASAFTSHVGPE